MKSAVLVLALAAVRRASAGSRSGYGYPDMTLYMLEWITYLKRLSLIALMVCAVVLYYVPTSRLPARRACCALIDYIANGLKSILSITEIKYEHVMARNNQNNEKKEARIQRQHRKLLKENINDYRQKQAKKININDCRSMRKQEKAKSRAKHDFDERQRLHDHHQRSAAVKDASLESGAMITPISDNSPQMEITNDECERNNIVVLQATFPEIKCDLMTDSLKQTTNLQQKGFIKDSARTEFSSFKETVLDASDENATVVCKDSEQSSYSFTDNPPIQLTEVSDDSKKINCIYFPNKELQVHTPEKQETSVNDIDKIDNNLRKRRNLNNTQHEKLALNTSQRQSRKDYISSVMNNQLDPYRRETVRTYDSLEKLQRENHQFLLNMKKIVDDCYYENGIIKNRAKPVLLRAWNWLFGGCPQASRRHREQLVGKEEILDNSNAWLRRRPYPLL